MIRYFNTLILLSLCLSCGRSNDTSFPRSKPAREQNQQTRERTEYQASVTSKISVSLKEITFLESHKAVDQDRSGTCFVETRSGTNYPFRLFEDDLVLTENGRELEFERIEGRAFSLNGRWTRTDEVMGMEITTTLEISGSKELKLQSECRKI